MINLKLSAKIDVLALIVTALAVVLAIFGVMFLTPTGEQSKLVNRACLENPNSCR